MSSSQIPLLSGGTCLEQIDLEWFYGWGIYYFSGQPGTQGLATLCETLLLCTLLFPSLSLTPSPLVLSQWALIKSLSSSYLTSTSCMQNPAFQKVPRTQLLVNAVACRLGFCFFSCPTDPEVLHLPHKRYFAKVAAYSKIQEEC